MISKLGNNVALSAAQLANQICSIPLLFLIGLSAILAPLIASAKVHKDYEKATKILQHVITINLVFGILSTVLIISFTSELHRLGQSKEVTAFTKDYLCIIGMSIIPNAINNAIKKYLEALGWTFTTMCTTVLAGILNVCLNYILIYGKFGFPQLGLNGAGWATLATRTLFMCIYITYIFMLKNKGYMLPFSKQLFEESLFIKLFKLGLPSGLDLAVKMAYYTTGIILLGWCINQEVAQASTGFIFDILRFIIMLPLAINSSASILIGKQWGRKSKLNIIRVAKLGYTLALALMLLTALTLHATYPIILSNFYSPTQEVDHLIKLLFPLIILFYFADGFNLVSVGMLRGLHDTFVPFLLSGFAYACIGAPTSYIAFKLHYQASGVWTGLIVGLLCSALLLTIRFYYKAKYIKLPSYYTAE